MSVLTVPSIARAAHAGAAGDRAAAARAAMASAERSTGVRRDPISRRGIELPEGLAGLLPWGVLPSGEVVVVSGSTGLLLSLLAVASEAGAWAAVVGMPTLGLLAAEQCGVDLGRLVMVPDPGAEAHTVVGALLDGMDVVVLGELTVLAGQDRRRLLGRARERGSTLLSAAAWPGAAVVLEARVSRWTGAGTGDGHLREQRLTVTRTGRGAASAPLDVELLLPSAAAPVVLMPGQVRDDPGLAG